MKPIGEGQTGPAVEDVQNRLMSLGFVIDDAEKCTSTFGSSTLQAVRGFRIRQGLTEADEVDDATWLELVDETYAMGDRTLYLRLPHFRGADVRHLQATLNVLGFSCGEPDGLYGPHTEAAVAEFQANVGLMADGMAFQDTFDAIERLHHVWRGQTVNPEFSTAHSGLVRAADVLERVRMVISATDPVARNVASRMWNVAYATTSEAHVVLVDSLEHTSLADVDLALTISTAELQNSVPTEAVTVTMTEMTTALTQRFTAALLGMQGRTSQIFVRIPELDAYDGSVTARKVQAAAVLLLDALCAALSACSS